MPKEEQRDRMRAMRTLVAEFNVYRWAGRMLVDAARLRQAGAALGAPQPAAAGAARGRGVMRDILAPANREVLDAVRLLEDAAGASTSTGRWRRS